MAIESIKTITSFPAPTFLENTAIRHDDLFLLTSRVKNTFFLSTCGLERGHSLHIFEHNCTGAVAAEPDVFYVSVSSEYVLGSTSLSLLDMDKHPPEPFTIIKVFEVPGAK